MEAELYETPMTTTIPIHQAHLVGSSYSPPFVGQLRLLGFFMGRSPPLFFFSFLFYFPFQFEIFTLEIDLKNVWFRKCSNLRFLNLKNVQI
jgi:hypothetical protein